MNRFFSKVIDLNFFCFLSNENKKQDTLRTAQRYNIAGREIQEEKLLSEGGYGYIWKAFDTNTKEYFALKKMICQGPERVKMAKNEIEVLRKLPVCENIMRFYDAQIIPTEDGCIAILLLEFCSGGSIFDLMERNEKTGFSESQVISIIKAIAKGLKVMHCLKPPIAHRDIKIENVLINNGKFKLCDFGSCSSEHIDFSQISPSEFYSYEEFYEKNTTLMYRPPEMSDLYLKYEVWTKVDIWMLGCVLYTICFFKHPFQDAAKLAISTAKYSMPKNSRYSAKLLDFIRHMLTPNPKFRPDIHEVLEITEKYDLLSEINLNPQARDLKVQAANEETEMRNFEKSIKPLKRFDGDIPMEELMNLKKKIENDTTDKTKPKQKKPLFINKNPEPSTRPINNSSNNNNNWSQGFSNTNLPQNFSSFDGFNNNFQSNSKPQEFNNFSNFNQWTFEKKDNIQSQNQDQFSSFGNNFNFTTQTNNNFPQNVQTQQKNISNQFSSFDNNTPFMNSQPNTAVNQDYSQFFNAQPISNANLMEKQQTFQPVYNNSANFYNNNENKQNFNSNNNIKTNSPQKTTLQQQTQTLDLIGLDDGKTAPKQTKQINLLEDLNNLNFI